MSDFSIVVICLTAVVITVSVISYKVYAIKQAEQSSKEFMARLSNKGL